MNKREYLLTKFIEECLETAQRATKILTFGADEVQPGQTFSNTARLNHEFNDLLASVELLAEEADIELFRDVSLIIRKRAKVEKFMEYSRQQGCLTDEG